MVRGLALGVEGTLFFAKKVKKLSLMIASLNFLLKGPT
jgi:hypothetical protein